MVMCIRHSQNRTAEAGVPALDVANYLIEYSGYTKTNLQIMKLTYIAHGYMLAIHDRPLIQDNVAAWDRGPVIANVYHAFKRWGSRVIGRTTYTPEPFGAEERKVIDAVFASYGRYCGYYLSQITHDDGERETPWRQCYEPGKNVWIPDEVTKEYYGKIIGDGRPRANKKSH